MGVGVEFLGKIIDTNTKKESLLVYSGNYSNGGGEYYNISKCFVQQNKFICENVIYTEAEYSGSTDEYITPSVILKKANLNNNYLNIIGEIVKFKEKYPFEARFYFNQKTGDFFLKEIVINKQFLSILSEEDSLDEDYLKNNPNLNLALNEIIKKYKIQLKGPPLAKLDILYENKQYTIIFFQDEKGNFFEVAFPKDNKNLKFYKLYSDGTMIFGSEKKLPNAIRALLLFYYNANFGGEHEEDLNNVEKIKCLIDNSDKIKKYKAKDTRLR